jgi:NAD(P)-dependent dehydrogenase (short-subunit alcohol dehydrogenase family)
MSRDPAAMSIDLSTRVAIVTGASSGLGEAIARKLASEGAKTVLAARSKDKLEALAAEIKSRNGTTLVCQTDVSKEADILRMFKATMDAFGRVDIMINNAGIAQHKPTTEVTTAEWQQIVDTNLTSAFICSREAMKIMKQQKRGRIINIGSVSATVPRANSVGYAATKFALDGLTHSMALDGREFGITVSILHPGVADSALSGKRTPDRPPEQMMQASEIADIIHLMVSLPDTTNLMKAMVLPIGMTFLGRG